MTFDMACGIILTISALGAVALLTLWSRYIIDRIHGDEPGSLREIHMNFKNGKES
jgi:hypothetical protein